MDDMGKMDEMAKVIAWFGGRDTGMSSKAIASHMTTGNCDGSYPHDPDDLGRCLRLLVLFPHWKPRLPEMGHYSDVWAKYAARWAEMEACMAEEVGIDWSKGRRAEKTYNLMAEVRSAQPEEK